MIAEAVPCGPDPDAIVDKIRSTVDAGASHVYVHHIGEDQEEFCEFWKMHIAPALTSS